MINNIITVSDKFITKVEARTGLNIIDIEVGEEADLFRGQILAHERESNVYLVNYGYTHTDADGVDWYTGFKLVYVK